MKPNPPTPPYLEQVFLLERDPGLLCRLLGLYAARGVDVTAARYEHAAQDVMMLSVAALDDPETLRVLVEKARTLVGVIAASERPTPAKAADEGVVAVPSRA